jgi:hypothetical protein
MNAAMTTTIETDHANELIVVDEALDQRSGAVVALGLVNRDGSDTFPGRTLSPDQAEELAARLALFAAVARARAGLTPPPVTGEQAHARALSAIRAAVALTGKPPSGADGPSEQADAPAAASKPARSATLTSDATVGVQAAAGAAGEAQQPDPARDPQDLPIAGYDGLSAAVIAKRLSGLSQAQLAKVLAYEQSHRNRKTILARIAALQSTRDQRLNSSSQIDDAGAGDRWR